MDENAALIEKLLREDALTNNNWYDHHNVNTDQQSQWKTVSYNKKNKKSSSKLPIDHEDTIDIQSEDRRSSAAVVNGSGDGSKRHWGDDDEEEEVVEVEEEESIDADGGGAVVNGGAGDEVKAKKKKKVKKVKVTLAEAAAKIDAGHLGAFLVDITASYETQQDIQLMRFADYFGRAFAAVGSAQFPWLKMFKESTLAKMIDIPLSYIAEDVYQISVDWISERSVESLGSFVLWSLDNIMTDITNHEAIAKGSKKVVQQEPPKSQVAIFVALAMVLRRKPEVLISLFPIMKENSKYQGQDKVPVTVWMIAQASQGDLAVGLHMWVRALFPMLAGKSNPQSRDLILQLLERILSSPKARTILVNGAVRKGERLVPPSALEGLMKLTFVSSSARIKATERFEAIYPTLKEVSLSGVPELSREGSDIFIWCLTQNPECYKQWDMHYLDNLEASAIILGKLSDEWKERSAEHPALDSLKETLKSFRQKNEKALAQKQDAARYATLKEADRHCKVILGRSSGGGGACMKSIFVISAAMALGAVAIAMSQNMESSWDLKNLLETFSST
ncbi:hypothetical protein ACFE04_006415 [Oxalis oulophora]